MAETSRKLFPDELLEEITEIRVTDPDRILRECQQRVRRKALAQDGRLMIVAADHPGRGVIRAGEDPLGMARRADYLIRIVQVLLQPGVDGVMATPDILEELILINSLFKSEGQGSFLDEKIIVGCLNRGGIAGARFEMRDRFTAFTARQLERVRFDAAKLMFRLDLENPDSGATIADCAEALRELERRNIPAFLEPLPVRLRNGKYEVVKQAQELIQVIGIATALGNSSRHLWLKIPFVEDFSEVVRATTCPLLMLGGESRANPEALLEDFSRGLSSGPNVRGVLVGRNVLFPGDLDPASMAAAIAALVRDSGDVQRASRLLKQEAWDRTKV